MKENQASILQIFGDRRRQSLSSHEIRAALKLPPTAKRSLHRQLREMERQGLLKRVRGGRYSLCRTAAPAEGIVAVDRRGEGWIEREKGRPVRIPARYLAGAADGDRVRYVKMPSDRMNQPNGRIIEIVERSGKLLVGAFQPGRDGDYILPVDSTFSQPMPIEIDAVTTPEAGDWVVIRPGEPNRPGDHPRARLVEVLGSPSDPKTDMKATACRFSIPLHFPPGVSESAESLDAAITDSDFKGRKDLRHLAFVTIDGESAQDFDDAVIVQKEAGGYRLYVAIADVSRYVSSGDEIDRAARERGTSVYFPGYCIPMLPEALSNDLCSLKPQVERLVMTAEIDIDSTGVRRSSSFYPAVIKSRARLTYTQVQRLLDEIERGGSPQDEFEIGLMYELSQLLGRQRRQRGSLDLDVPEAEIKLDDDGWPEHIRFAERLAAHRIVEEFMLTANEAVAGYLAGQNSDFPYRIHEPPAPDDFMALNSYLKTHGLPELTFGHDLHPELQQLIGTIEDAGQRRIVSRMLLRSMKQARYSIENVGHYGLAAKKYCHFTSPIRRYPDLLVHRVLKRTISGAEQTLSKTALAEMAEHASQRERLAVDAERDVQAMLTCHFMQEKVGETFAGAVSSVQKFGLFVELDAFPVEGLVHIARMEDDYYIYDSEQLLLLGERAGRTFRIGTPVKVRVESVSVARREIDFTLLADNTEDRSERTPRKRRRRRG